MKLHRKFKDEYDIDGHTFEINASFDNILKVMKLLGDNRVHPMARPMLGLRLLIGHNTFEADGEEIEALDLLEKYEFDDQVEIFKHISEMYIEFDKPKLDRQGNEVPTPGGESNAQVLDYEQDAEYIYASFMQAYQIDLIDQQGKLHWNKFKALLNGLPKGTKVVEVISIRSWKPSDDKKKRTTAMREAQRIYRLKGEEE